VPVFASINISKVYFVNLLTAME